MARPSPYDDKQKAAILAAVASGRKSGKKWPEVLKAAEAEGYKGGLAYLMKLSRAPGAIKGRRRRGRVGRPKGSRNAVKRGPGWPKGAASTSGVGLSQIDAIVAGMVEQRVRSAIGQAIKALDLAAETLKKL